MPTPTSPSDQTLSSPGDPSHPLQPPSQPRHPQSTAPPEESSSPPAPPSHPSPHSLNPPPRQPPRPPTTAPTTTPHPNPQPAFPLPSSSSHHTPAAIPSPLGSHTAHPGGPPNPTTPGVHTTNHPHPDGPNSLIPPIHQPIPPLPDHLPFTPPDALQALHLAIGALSRQLNAMERRIMDRLQIFDTHSHYPPPSCVIHIGNDRSVVVRTDTSTQVVADTALASTTGPENPAKSSLPAPSPSPSHAPSRRGSQPPRHTTARHPNGRQRLVQSSKQKKESRVPRSSPPAADLTQNTSPSQDTANVDAPVVDPALPPESESRPVHGSSKVLPDAPATFAAPHLAEAAHFSHRPRINAHAIGSDVQGPFASGANPARSNSKSARISSTRRVDTVQDFPAARPHVPSGSSVATSTGERKVPSTEGPRVDRDSVQCSPKPGMLTDARGTDLKRPRAESFERARSLSTASTATDDDNDDAVDWHVTTEGNGELTSKQKDDAMPQLRTVSTAGLSSAVDGLGPPPLKKKRHRDNWSAEEDELFFTLCRDNSGMDDPSLLRLISDKMAPRRSYQQVKSHLKNMRSASKL